MLRSAWLTYRMHQFEVLFSAALLAVFAAAVWFVSTQINDLNIPATCWPRDLNGNYANVNCDALMNQFWGLSGTAEMPRRGLAILPPVVGLILGVPIVAREIELRTTDLAWSLALRRSRWLISRLAPMLALALVGFAVLGLLGSMLFGALSIGREPADLTEVASQGPTLVARGFLALAVATAVGVVVGRTMPALLLAGLLILLYSLFVVPQVQGFFFGQYAVWQRDTEIDWRNADNPIAYLADGYFDVSRPGINGEPGARIAPDQVQATTDAVCGPQPEDGKGDFGTWDTCQQGLHWSRIVPLERYGDFQAIDAGTSLVLGGVFLLLTFPAVARRRPA